MVSASLFNISKKLRDNNAEIFAEKMSQQWSLRWRKLHKIFPQTSLGTLLFCPQGALNNEVDEFMINTTRHIKWEYFVGNFTKGSVEKNKKKFKPTIIILVQAFNYRHKWEVHYNHNCFALIVVIIFKNYSKTYHIFNKEYHTKIYYIQINNTALVFIFRQFELASA